MQKQLRELELPFVLTDNMTVVAPMGPGHTQVYQVTVGVGRPVPKQVRFKLMWPALFTT